MSNNLKEDKIQPIVIDFNELRENKLDESWLGMFGANVKYILKGIFGDWVPDITVRGRNTDINAFARALEDEADLQRSIKRYGLDDPRTWQSRYKLDSAARKFKNSTGIDWPFK
tara:strand:- start:847 stop:1188 length:342 start_codon:yes stop_codon:yes gene_type:complete